MPAEDKIDVYVKITKQGAKYSAFVFGHETASPEKEITFLQTPTPFHRMPLEQILESFGFHQRDIFDAFDIADGQSANIKHPLW